jgi:DNA (cytosine-5)-methyltransferase 1
MVFMRITYKPLFHLLVERGLKKTDLIEKADISRMTLAKFAKNEPVSLEIIERAL